jgi:hypothetical protein
MNKFKEIYENTIDNIFEYKKQISIEINLILNSVKDQLKIEEPFYFRFTKNNNVSISWLMLDKTILMQLVPKDGILYYFEFNDGKFVEDVSFQQNFVMFLIKIIGEK